jgi:hypothetical protein
MEPHQLSFTELLVPPPPKRKRKKVRVAKPKPPAPPKPKTQRELDIERKFALLAEQTRHHLMPQYERLERLEELKGIMENGLRATCSGS